MRADTMELLPSANSNASVSITIMSGLVSSGSFQSLYSIISVALNCHLTSSMQNEYSADQETIWKLCCDLVSADLYTGSVPEQ